MNPARILLVEDNPGDADLTRETLEESGLLLDVHAVPDGAEAMRYLVAEVDAGRTLPDLVVLDLNLPRLDGRSVLAAIRANKALQALPVVVLTSSEAERDVADSYALGANCYVTKPVDLQAFQAAVRSIGGFWFTVVKLP